VICCVSAGVGTILLLLVSFIPGLRDIPPADPGAPPDLAVLVPLRAGSRRRRGRTQASRQDPCGPVALTGFRWLRLRYEDLAASPRTAAAEIAASLSLSRMAGGTGVG
jgi:hypothetical protein